ncbi:MAG: DUF1343 domain-containing protein [Bacteroidota bacterium]
MRIAVTGLALIFMLLSGMASFAQPFFDSDVQPADAKPEKYIALLEGKRVALIINHTSVIGNESLLDLLLARKIAVRKIFVPEHGFRGNEDAGAKIDNAIDKATGLPVISLYGKHKKPTPEDMADIDVVVYDLQDVGVRFYTYISTLEYCMEACAQNHKQLMVLDRPNPNGFYVDGPVLKEDNKSFVGMQQIPIVYGMTAGEYAKMLKGEGWFDNASQLDLKVILCINYTHAKRYKLPVPPSPNLRTMAAIYAYPSLCLFEGTPVSVGRGTDMPFQQYGCPEFEGKYTYSFTPRSVSGAKNPPHENKLCYGELIGKTEEEVLRQTQGKFRLHWLIKAYGAYPDKDKFFNGFFVKLYGQKGLAKAIAGDCNNPEEAEDQVRRTWKKDLASFRKIRKRYLLYPDAPEYN